jgi:hypothetical protein
MTPTRNRQTRFQTKAQREALRVLADYFCLNIKMAADLLGISERAAQFHYERLQKEQLVYAFRYYPEHQKRGAAPYAYGLSDSGVTQAFEDGFATDSTKTFRGHSPRTIEHELTISRFHLELAALAESKQWDLRWRQTNLKRTVHPDALFAINGKYFFLEIERAKLGNYRDGEPQIVRKLRSYWDYYDSTGCESEFGLRKFRVATVMRTPERAANLGHILRGNHLDKATFLIASEPRMLAFTSAKDLSSVPLEAILL